MKKLYTETRPWGSFTVLEDCENYKVKRLNVKAGKRLSLQSHDKRCEKWILVEGEGKFTIDCKVLHRNATEHQAETLFIPRKAVHRIKAVTDLTIIEIQQGDYFGEDDIIRYEDDFNRK